MGMFDWVNCKVKDWELTGAQSKSTPEQQCDLYEINENGEFWDFTGEAPVHRKDFSGCFEFYNNIEYYALIAAGYLVGIVEEKTGRCELFPERIGVAQEIT